MAVNALFITTILFMALGLVLLEECRFLIPYRGLLTGPYARPIGLFAAALFLNIFTAVHVLCRKVFLKDTGRKLAHLEKQLRTDASVSPELAERLQD